MRVEGAGAGLWPLEDDPESASGTAAAVRGGGGAEIVAATIIASGYRTESPSGWDQLGCMGRSQETQAHATGEARGGAARDGSATDEADIDTQVLTYRTNVHSAASDDEVSANPRARSARLRVGERTEVPLSG
mgnify:CR=1 FL=1